MVVRILDNEFIALGLELAGFKDWKTNKVATVSKGFNITERETSQALHSLPFLHVIAQVCGNGTSCCTAKHFI
jgi:hypothetical protein